MMNKCRSFIQSAIFVINSFPSTSYGRAAYVVDDDRKEKKKEEKRENY